MRANRSMSPWIWRRFISSYRQQDATDGSPISYVQGATPIVGVTGVGTSRYLASATQTLLAARTSMRALNITNNGEQEQDEVGAVQSLPGNLPSFIASPGRRVAVKKIAGVLDLFPIMSTFGLGDVLYAHLAIQRIAQSVGSSNTPTGLSSLGAPSETNQRPYNIYDLDGRHSRPLWYRRHNWFFGNFAGLNGNITIQGCQWSCPIKVTFRRPLVLDVDEYLQLQVIADLQPAAVSVGVYYITYLPYISMLCRSI